MTAKKKSGVSLEERVAAIEEVVAVLMRLAHEREPAPVSVLEQAHQDLVARVRERRARSGRDS